MKKAFPILILALILAGCGKVGNTIEQEFLVNTGNENTDLTGNFTVSGNYFEIIDGISEYIRYLHGLDTRYGYGKGLDCDSYGTNCKLNLTIKVDKKTFEFVKDIHRSDSIKYRIFKDKNNIYSRTI